MTRFARARQVGDAVVESALDAIADSVPAPPAGVLRAVVVNADAVERAQVVDAFIDLPIDSAEPWRNGRRAGARSAGHVLAARSGASPSVSGRRRPARRVPGARRRAASSCHVMSRYETPWALERPARSRALVGAGAAAVRLCGVRSSRRVRPGKPRESVPRGGGSARRQRAATRRPTDAAVTAGSRRERAAAALGQRRWDVRRRRQGDRRRRIIGVGVARGRRRRRRRVQLLAARVGSPRQHCRRARDRRRRASSAGPLRATFRVELELPLPIAASRDRSQPCDRIGDRAGVRSTPRSTPARRASHFAVTVDNRANDHRLRMLFPTGAARRRQRARRHGVRRRDAPGTACRCRRRSGTNRRSAARR